MKTKVLEIRDRGTFIPILAVDMNLDGSDFTGAERYLLRRCGYPCDGHPNIAITHLAANGTPCNNDPHYWQHQRDSRTYPVAHDYIIKNWDTLKDGDVVDVEWILGESSTKKISERFEDV